MSAMNSPDAGRHDDGGLSRWSSGSEDEVDRPLAFMSASRRIRRARQSSASPAGTAAQPRKGSVTSASTSSTKRPSFFNTIGLRKKSLPDLQAATADSSPYASPVSPSPATFTDSPSIARADLVEFPFEKASRPSFSFGRPSLSLGSRASFTLRGGPPFKLFQREQTPTPQPASPKCSASPKWSAPAFQSTPMEHSPSLSVSSMSRQDSDLSFAFDSVSNLPSSVSTTPCMELSESESMQRRTRKKTPPSLQKDTLDRIRAQRQRAGSSASPTSSSAPATPRTPASVKSHRSEESLQSRSVPLVQQPWAAAEPKSPLSPRSPRKRSVTLDTSVQGAARSREAGRQSSGSNVAFPSIAEQRRLSAKSPSETPRIAARSLHISGDVATSTHQRHPSDEDSDPLFNVSGNLSQPYRRARRTESGMQPQYTSSTDKGRSWQAKQPEKAFGSALGSAMLDWAIAESTLGEEQQRGHAASRESDSGTDDYGSSDTSSSGSRQQGHSQQGLGANGGDDGPESRDAAFQKAQAQADKGDSSDSDSESDGAKSHDSYGRNESGLPSVDPKRLNAVEHGSTGSSSDDAPLGRRLQEMQLQDTERARSHSIKAVEVGQVASKGFDAAIGVNHLDDRLSGLQRAQTVSARKPTAQAIPERIASKKHSMDTAALARRATQAGSHSNRPSQQLHRSESQSLSPRLRSEKPLPNIVNAQANIIEAETYRRTGDVVLDFAETVRARSRSRAGIRPLRLDVQPPNAPLPALPTAYQTATRKDVLSPTSSPSTLARTQSIKVSDHAKSHDRASHATDVAAQAPVETVLHRVHVNNLQSYATVRIPSTARVSDLIAAVLQKESMHVEAQSANWVLFDVCSSMQLERPLREFEVVSDVVASRTAKTDSFILRRSEFAPYLGQQAVPTATPSIGGYLYVQDNYSLRKRSWSKRWVELRNDALYHSKTDKSRDSAQICHLSSFDVYRPAEGKVSSFKAPKDNVFALRSVDAIHLFEDPEKDYAFFFSLSDDAAARHWITTLLRARSCILRHEKANLFRAPSAAHGPARQPTTAPAKPLLSFAPEQFEKGSLLEQQQTTAEGIKSANEGVAPYGLRSAPAADEPAFRGNPPTSAQGSFEAAGSRALGSHSHLQASNSLRHDELVQAERRGRMDGRPLIGLVDDMSRFGRYPATGASSSKR